MPAKRLLPVLLILVIAAGGWWWWSHRSAVPAGTLTLYGNIDVRQVDLAFLVEGKIVELSVDEGNKIAAGQLLARLDVDPYNDTVAVAEARVENQAALVAKLEAGSRPQELARARADVEEARARLANAEGTLQRTQTLAQQDFAARQKLDDTRAEAQSARASVDARQADLALLEEGPRKEDIAAARALLKSEQALLSLARYRLSETSLVAPSAGTVLTRAREVGAVVAAGSIVFSVALSDPVWVRTYVGEPDLGKLRPGMAVDVTTDSHPDKVYRGSVGFVSPTAEFTPKSVETPELRTDLVYRLRVIVENPDDGLRQGMPVTVTVHDDGRR